MINELKKGLYIISIKRSFIAIILVIATLALAPAKVSALSDSDPYSFDNNFLNSFNFNLPLLVNTEPDQRVIEPPSSEPEPEESKPPEPAKYVVKSGDNLSTIAEENNTTWPRLWNKNKSIKHPDRIHIDQVLIIPLESEVLKDRPIPQPPRPQVQRQNVQSAPQTAPRGYNGGNTYSAGYCTWYAKSRRPDLPNNLGNANTWYTRAAAQGIPTGSAPRAGAIGATTAGDLGHVVYVERVNGDGTVLISEMNYEGLYIQSSRTVSASKFVYIY